MVQAPTRTQSTRVAAYGLITRPQEILLCRLSDKVPRYAGQWTLPGGGVEFGEHPETAMLREVQEETGLSVTSGGLAGIDSMLLNGQKSDHHGIRIIYFALNPIGELRHETDGTTDLGRWCSFAELQHSKLNELVLAGLKLAFPEQEWLESEGATKK